MTSQQAPEPQALCKDLTVQLKSILMNVKSVSEAEAALEQWGPLAKESQDFQTRLLYQQLLERAGHGALAVPGWDELFEERPSDPLARRYRVICQRRKGDLAGARKTIEQVCKSVAREENAVSSLKLRAELLADIGETEASFAIYRELISVHNTGYGVHVDYARRLMKLGRYYDAFEVLEELVIAQFLPKNANTLYREAQEKIGSLLKLGASREQLVGTDCRLVALERLISLHEERSISVADGSHRVAMITGSLGPGGAERQLVKLTRILVEEQQENTSDGTAKDHYEVIVRRHQSLEKASDFFLPELIKQDIPVSEIDRLKPIAADSQIELSEYEKIIYSMLPAPVHYGVVRLAPYLRDNKFSAVSIWQDGACLFAAIAALFAETSQIQLVFRGLPPNIRKHRDRPEYKILYRGLAKVPGVKFVANSQAVANEYAAWIGIPVENFVILYNAITPSPIEGSHEDTSTWEAFAARTAGCSKTIGGVMRFVSDKQPLRWVRMAALILKRQPDMRFVLLGNGRLSPEVRSLATSLGLTERLFVP